MHIRTFTPKTALITAAALAAATAAALGGAGLAGASARPAASGTEHFQLMTTSATAKTLSTIGTGLFTAGGTSTNASNSSKGTVTFPGGTFVITHSKGTGTQHFNPKTCLLQISEKGTYTLGSGTGAYKGITGNGTYQLAIVAVGAKSGGTCSKTLPPPTWQQVITASGPASLP